MFVKAPLFLQPAGGISAASVRLLAFLCAGAGCGIAGFTGTANASTTAESPEGSAFFESRIRPLLIEHCYECHSAERNKLKGGLALDTREGIERGGESGPLLQRGQPDASRLIEAVRYQNRDFQMPPKKPLPEHAVRDLEQWVRMGAPDPRTTVAVAPRAISAMSVEEGRSFWAFRRPVRPAIPPPGVPAEDHPVDRFLASSLRAAGLREAPLADKASLLRRVTFDLTGLPPTPEEIEAFSRDDSPSAYARVVDRLLASAAYGERWGRHWLDVARYADSNGLDENVAFGNAWRYRDYVVDAFNADKPYDRFIREQIAGDLLPAETAEQQRELRSALGFLSIGPKLLAEVDKVKLEMDLIDEQIDTIGKSLMGMTLGCARCHSHKFDPIPTEDYYALAAIFKSTRTMDDLKTIAKWHESSVATPAEQARFDAHQRLVTEAKNRLGDLIAEANEQVLGARALETLPPKPENAYAPQTASEIKTARERLALIEKEAPELPSAMGVVDKALIAETLPVHVRGSHLNPGRIVPRGFLQVMSVPGRRWEFSGAQSGRLEFANWLSGPEHPLVARVMVNRIWRWHFGRGLVATPDNFGALGEAPSHPELLDWLACTFVEGGWSVKSMHRIILHSAAYRRSAQPADAAIQALVDPANRLLSHFPPRRLEAEEIRDALHAVAGLLDRTRGGKTIPLKNREFVFNHTSKDATTYESPRRALYLPVIRNNLYDLLEQFDFPDPAVSNGNRNTTSVASQALLLLNSEVVFRAARGMASLLQSQPGDVSERITRAYIGAFGREPSPEETRRARDFVMRPGEISADETPDRWEAFCRLLFAANEFIYLN